MTARDGDEADTDGLGTSSPREHEARAGRSAPPPSTVVVLGCRPVWSPDGRLRGALGRRVGAGYARYCADLDQGPARPLVVSGGRTWGAVLEADAMRAELLRAGLDAGRVVRERCSLTTFDNARLTASLLRRQGTARITLVTCDWHVPRASALFRLEGLVVEPCPVASPAVSRSTRLYREVHEWVSARRRLGGRPRTFA